MGMIEVFLTLREVLSVYFNAWTAASDEYFAGCRSGIPESATNALQRLKGYVRAYEEFSEQWFYIFMHELNKEIDRRNIPNDLIDSERDAELEDARMVKWRKAMREMDVVIPRCIHDVPTHYAVIQFTLSFFNHSYADRHYYPAEFGTSTIWTAETDISQWKMLLTSPEPYEALKVFKSPNFLQHLMSNGRPLTKANKNILERHKMWQEKWHRARLNWKEEYGGSRRDQVVYKAPKRPKNYEQSYIFKRNTYYMRCTGCDYISVFPSDVDISKIATLTKSAPEGATLFTQVREKGYRLNLENIEFCKDMKYKHPYKWMQKHIKNCPPAIQVGIPPCFGKSRKRKRDCDEDSTSSESGDHDADLHSIPTPIIEAVQKEV